MPAMISKSALSTWEQCPRKFYLSRVVSRHWPAPSGHDPASAEAGNAFHRMVERHMLGIPDQPPDDPVLTTLWRAFLASPHGAPEGEVFTEQTLQFTLGRTPVLVRYDRLIREQDGRWAIIDWKTGRSWREGRIDEARVRDDWQTRLYRFALVQAGPAVFNAGAPIPPEAVRMVYWALGDRLVLPYSRAQYQADRARIEAVLARIEAEDFPQRLDHCDECPYRLLCHGVPAIPDDAAETPALPRFVLPEVPDVPHR